ncbi:MAG: ABC transporter ATP-binding protein [Anaerovoracaceae bacterium]|jgi:ABC-2 type transport system ATP-binding protein
MIAIRDLKKSFGRGAPVLHDVSVNIADGTIYGLTGYNGAGKTTLLKLLCGIYRPQAGTIRIDDAEVYENPAVKRKMFMMTEELFILPQATLPRMESFYRGYYPTWDSGVYTRLMRYFNLPANRSINEFSKGMQRQTGLMTAFASGATYLLLDEAFDGLDLGIRRTMRQLLREYVKARSATVILTSHNLVELEQCVTRFGMIDDGSLRWDMSVEELRRSGRTLEEFFLDRKETNYDEPSNIF